jgi:hypothetical protein
LKKAPHIIVFLLVLLNSCSVFVNRNANQTSDNTAKKALEPPGFQMLDQIPGAKLKHMSLPPGTIMIAENLYMDDAEISIMSWREYMSWIANVYGYNSKEFKESFPDSTVWDFDSTLIIKNLHKNYLNHRAYDDYPVVGISYDQAIKFSKWRSDVVYELMLVTAKVIKYYKPNHPDSVFTIEKYLSGNYRGYVPDSNYLTYPEYSLPDLETWKKGLAFADSLNAKHFKKCKKQVTTFNDPGIIEINSIEKTRNWDFTEATFIYCRKAMIYHMRGNVRELSIEKGIAYGGGWRDSLNTIMTQDTFQDQNPNAWTGFRNVCRYRNLPQN